ncbi:hypothetical protein AVEN_57017-1 [Araneus ventricosus]|uniref:Uncharacterized protein n=1 Tax=Araneus ventricosus TaxID=182803 RepID=A0A4Y2QNZ5_ARAVE|nr:hypothetical protein AVEN_57017-1 [Araneus ventricosus]
MKHEWSGRYNKNRARYSPQKSPHYERLMRRPLRQRYDPTSGGDDSTPYQFCIPSGSETLLTHTSVSEMPKDQWRSEGEWRPGHNRIFSPPSRHHQKLARVNGAQDMAFISILTAFDFN